MKKFEVCFQRDTSEQLTMTIEADSEDYARDLALDMLSDGRLRELDWEQTDFLGDDQLIYVAESKDALV